MTSTAYCTLVNKMFLLVTSILLLVQIGHSSISIPQQFVLSQPKITAPDNCATPFGYPLAISRSGNVFVTSCPFAFDELGFVVVFGRHPISGEWTQEMILNGTDKVLGALEGLSVSLSDDGSTLASGALVDGQIGAKGSVFIYVREGYGQWSQQAKLINLDTGLAGFGYGCALSADGNTLAVVRTDSDQLDIYVRVGTDWNHKVKFPNTFDILTRRPSVAISPDGKLVAVQIEFIDYFFGGEFNDVYFFQANANGEWSRPENPTTLELYGNVLLETLTFAEGSKYLFSIFNSEFVTLAFNGTDYEEVNRYNDAEYFHVLTKLATDKDGQYVALGVSALNKTTILWRTSTSPLQYEVIQNITLPDEQIGGVAMSGDGRWVIISSAYSGNEIYIYERRPSEICMPRLRINKVTCGRRTTACASEGIQLKWTGTGCKKKGKKMGDGGCQCQGYCGYTCKRACNKDKECLWKKNRCHLRDSGKEGTPMRLCY